MAAYPSYLLRSRHSVFYFRISIPDALKPLFSPTRNSTLAADTLLAGSPHS